MDDFSVWDKWSIHSRLGTGASRPCSMSGGLQLAVGHGKSGQSCSVEGLGALDEDAAEIVAVPD